MKRRILAILLSLMLVLGLAACGSDSYKGSDSAAPSANTASAPGGYWAETADYAAEAPASEPETMAGGESRGSSLPDGVKMIYRANLDLETTEFDKAVSDIRMLTQSLGGYFEEQSTNNYSSGYRRADYTVRVPAERFDDFLRQLGDLCRITHQSQSAEDVSEFYYDTESRLETAKIKLDRLQELLSHAEEMEDIITLESAISETEYQIESLSGTLRHYDALVGYSTIYVNLAEVYRISETENAPLTFGQRLLSAFREGLENFVEGAEDFAEWFALNWLTLVVLAAVIVVVAKLWSRRKKKQGGGLLRRKKDKQAQTPPAEAPREDGQQ